VLTFFLGFIGYAKVTPNFLIPTECMLPLIVCRALGPILSVARVQNITRWAAAFMLFALLIGPIVAYASVAFHFDGKAQISRQVAIAATAAWAERIASPLRIATGTEQLSLALPFYSSDVPIEFTHYNFMEAPWITPERIAREGILYACGATDVGCIEAAKTYETAHTARLPLTFHSAFWGLRGPEIEVVLIMIPPRVDALGGLRPHALVNRTSDFVLFDAARIDAEPVVVVRLPQRVPQGLNGSWIPKA
jgi:hypothetical protein